MTGFMVNYSGIDRMVHNLAMSQLDMQKSLSRVEDRNFDKAHSDIAAADPVFITSLPRAGTTLLLELLTGATDLRFPSLPRDALPSVSPDVGPAVPEVSQAG